MRLKNIFFTGIVFILFISSVRSEVPGKVTGSIVDAETGEPLIGANIMIKGTTIGSSSDMNGHFIISSIPEGDQILTASYIAHEPHEIKIFVISRKVVEAHFVLQKQSLELDAVSVIAELRGNQDGGVLAKQKKSFHIEDGISSERMSRSGDSNAADALRRVTGASVKEGKYVTIRGLGERYTHTQVNGGPMASPEPDKKSIPLTLFPTALLESISVIKTFTPDLPGVFAGGFVNIKTKAYPDNYIFKLHLSLKDNSNIRQNKLFRRSDGGALDYFGFDDGTRKKPNDIPGNRMLNMWLPPEGTRFDQWRQELSHYGQEFQTSFHIKHVEIEKPISISADLGNRYNTTDYLEYGYFINGSFSNSYENIDSRLSTYSLHDDLFTPTHLLDNSKSAYKTNLAFGISSGLKWKQAHQFKLYYLYTHSSSDNVIYGTGMTPNIDNGVFIKQKFTEKSIRNLTLSGDHQLSRGRMLDWKMNVGDSHLSEPDEKSHNYIKYPGDNIFVLVTSSSKAGMRSFTSGRDMNGNIDVNYHDHIPIGSFAKMEIKTGFRMQGRHRVFRRRTFYHWLYGNDSQDIYTVRNQRFGTSFDGENFLSADSSGWILVENTDESGRSAYEANETISAQYFMISIPYQPRSGWIKNVMWLTGVRRENYIMRLTPYNGVTGVIYENPLLNEGETIGQINKVSYLPSANMILGFAHDIKLRFSFSKTIALPQFRELAPLEYQEFYGGDVVVGYQNLVSTDIQNYDIRFEWYPGMNQLVALSAFAKIFKHPIEAARFETADLTYKTFQNTPKAETSGIEFELRKHLSTFDSFGKTMIIFNSIWSQSQVDQNEKITLFNGESITNSAHSNHRPLQGQSNFMMNSEINLKTKKDFMLSVALNVFSKRLITIGSGNMTDVYEYPSPSLNATIMKRINDYSITLKLKNIMNSSIRFGQLDPKGKLMLTRIFRPGQSVSLTVGHDF